MIAKRAGMWVAGVLALAGCSRTSSSQCTDSSLKSVIQTLVPDWYLWPDLVAKGVDPAAYATPQDYLDALVANAWPDGKTRHLSYVTTATQQNQYFALGEAVGFGIGLLWGGTGSAHLLVSQTFTGSPADLAGFGRGDEILALGPSATALQNISDLIAADPTGASVNALIGPATIGLQVAFQVKKPDGTTVLYAPTKAVYSLDPVPPYQILTVGSGKAGYVMVRTFVETAIPLLESAFAAFGAAGVSDVIVDLRYDGGGLLDVAEALADLLGGVPYGGQVMYSVAVNPNHSPAEAGFPTAVTFGSVSQSLPSLSHVAFLVTGASASASELVPNALEPYLAPSIPAGQTPRLALVGSSTYGKPVGQLGFTVSGCDQAILLIAFQLKNKDGEGSYFDGLPDAAGQFGGTTCQATDDLGHAMGDPAEAMTAQAISWLANGAAACTAIPARTAAVVTTGRAQARPAAEREPLGDPATPELPGVR